MKSFEKMSTVQLIDELIESYAILNRFEKFENQIEQKFKDQPHLQRAHKDLFCDLRYLVLYGDINNIQKILPTATIQGTYLYTMKLNDTLEKMNILHIGSLCLIVKKLNQHIKTLTENRSDDLRGCILKIISVLLPSLIKSVGNNNNNSPIEYSTFAEQTDNIVQKILEKISSGELYEIYTLQSCIITVLHGNYRQYKIMLDNMLKDKSNMIKEIVLHNRQNNKSKIEQIKNSNKKEIIKKIYTQIQNKNSIFNQKIFFIIGGLLIIACCCIY
jgi:hypothetical protein